MAKTPVHTFYYPTRDPAGMASRSICMIMQNPGISGVAGNREARQAIPSRTFAFHKASNFHFPLCRRGESTPLSRWPSCTVMLFLICPIHSFKRDTIVRGSVRNRVLKKGWNTASIFAQSTWNGTQSFGVYPNCVEKVSLTQLQFMSREGNYGLRVAGTLTRKLCLWQHAQIPLWKAFVRLWADAFPNIGFLFRNRY